MQQNELIPHLFRTEFRKITAVLGKLFGIENIEIAEDIASETFLSAMETWSYNGTPENPSAWLYAVAKNKAKKLNFSVTFFQVSRHNDMKVPCFCTVPESTRAAPSESVLRST